MASSTEEVSGPNDLSGGSRRDDAAQDQFGVFKDFDFLEYESESVEVCCSLLFIPVFCRGEIEIYVFPGREHG